MVFIETPLFTSQIGELLNDDEYAEFQRFMEVNPDAGELIQKTGGLRKIRWTTDGRGKRGGIHVIYFHVSAAYQIRLLLAYKKGVQDDLTPAQKKALRKVIETWEVR